MTLGAVVLLVVVVTQLHNADAPLPWEGVALRYLVALTGLIVVPLGAMLVGSTAADERLLGTLDLHRLGPARPATHVLGLVLGAPLLVWVLFLALVPVVFSLALRGGVAPGLMGACLTSIAVTALLAWVATLVLALGGNVLSKGALHAAGLTIGLGLLGLGYLGYRLHLAPFYYGSGVGPWVYLAAPEAHVPRASLFGAPFPPLFYQLLVQGTLIALLWVAATRLIRPGQRPAWSKPQVLLLCGFLIAVFLGSMPGHPWLAGEGTPPIVLVTGYIILGLGILAAALVTPRRVDHVRAWHRLHDEEEPLYAAGFDDGASNFAWYLVYCAIAVGAGAGLLWLAPRDIAAPALVVFALALFQVGWVAGGLEAYYLSRGRFRRGIFFATAAFPWLIFPMVGVWMRINGHYPMFAPMLTSLSPITGLYVISQKATAMAGNWQSVEAIRVVIMPLLLNGCLAFITLVSAWATRMRMRLD